jgi:hypothetical protein
MAVDGAGEAAPPSASFMAVRPPGTAARPLGSPFGRARFGGADAVVLHTLPHVYTEHTRDTRPPPFFSARKRRPCPCFAQQLGAGKRVRKHVEVAGSVKRVV